MIITIDNTFHIRVDGHLIGFNARSSDSKVSLGKYIRSLKEVTDELVRAVGGV